MAAGVCAGVSDACRPPGRCVSFEGECRLPDTYASVQRCANLEDKPCEMT